MNVELIMKYIVDNDIFWDDEVKRDDIEKDLYSLPTGHTIKDVVDIFNKYDGFADDEESLEQMLYNSCPHQGRNQTNCDFCGYKVPDIMKNGKITFGTAAVVDVNPFE